MILGCHVGLSGSLMMVGSVRDAISYGANAFMIYTGAPQNTARKDISLLRAEEAYSLMKENNIELKNVVVHAPYIVNPGTFFEDKRDFAINFLTEEVKRTYALGSKVLVLHPGNTLNNDLNDTINNIAYVINCINSNTKDLDVVIALETMSGKGTEVGRNFMEVKTIIDKIEDKSRIGVCLDTCHVHDAGYDLVNNYDGVKKEFNDIIGLEYLKVIHLNDSKNECGAKKDRHENLGKGFIGLETLVKVCNDKDFENVPKILETPFIDGCAPYKEEIELIRSAK